MALAVLACVEPAVASSPGSWWDLAACACAYGATAHAVRRHVLDVQTRVQLAGFAAASVLSDVVRAAVTHSPPSVAAWLAGAAGALAGLWWGRSIAHARQAEAWRRRQALARSGEGA